MLKNGLFRNSSSRTWHYHFKQAGRIYKGDTGCEILAQAKAWLKAKREQVALAEVGLRPKQAIPTLEKAAELWQTAHLNKRSERHIDIVMTAFDLHMVDCHQVPLDQLDTGKVDALLSAYLAKGTAEAPRSPGGANVVLRALNCIVGYAVSIGRITSKPYSTKLLKVQETPRQRLSPSKLSDLFRVLKKHGAPAQVLDMVRLMVGLGLRRQEARTARVECIDLTARTFTPWDPTSGTKGKEADALPIPAWLAPHLERLVGDRTQGYLISGKRSELPAVLLVNQWLVKVRDELGLPSLTPHLLRAAYATLLSENGVSPQTIQKVLRHKQLKTTCRYLVPDVDQARRAAEAFGTMAGLDELPLGSRETPDTYTSVELKTA